MRVLITGGAGFLGFHLAHGLPQEKRLLDITPFAPEEWPDTIETVVADVRDLSAVQRSMENCDAVIHAAAGLPLWKPKEIRSVNFEGTRTVLQAAKNVGVPHVVHISSTAVYGIPDHHPLHESDKLIGVGPYGESKIQAEQLCEEARAQGQCITILRPKTFLGAERLGVFQILYDWIAEGRRIPVLGSGKNRYQLLAVEDLVEAVSVVLNAPPADANQTFNVGAKEFGTVEEDLTQLFQHAKTESRVFPVPALPAKTILAILDTFHCSPLYKWIYATADQDSFVNVDKLEKLGWTPKHSNASTLIATWDWYKENKDKLPQAGMGHRVPWNEGALRWIRKWM
ncbi:MAG: NAD(P)-dependent oxidoreductase [Planctomycetota bacterium]|mgnify:CR=1 FL=1|nr:NAD(P)-dependent oxidoreductase [Planctomycetota bacterium]